MVVGAAVLSGAPCAAWADTLSLVTSWNLDGSKGSWWVGDAASPADEAMRDGSAPHPHCRCAPGC